MRIPLFRTTVLASVLVACANISFAATYTVTPVRVELKPGERSYLLNLRNDSNKELRFQVSAHEWTQSVEGEAQLTPADSLIVFPALLTLAPGTERKVRLGLTKPFSPDQEATFRLIFEELPDPVTPTSGAQVQIVTKMSIPVFVQPRQLRKEAVVQQTRLDNGVLRFDVVNSGNTFFILNGVTVTGRKSDGAAFSKNLQGWYVLSGGRREYVVPLTSSECEKLTSVEIQAATDIRRNNEQVVIETTIPVDGCRALSPAQQPAATVTGGIQ
jgi:fimbrial chaperone protein